MWHGLRCICLICIVFGRGGLPASLFCCIYNVATSKKKNEKNPARMHFWGELYGIWVRIEGRVRKREYTPLSLSLSFYLCFPSLLQPVTLFALLLHFKQLAGKTNKYSAIRVDSSYMHITHAHTYKQTRLCLHPHKTFIHMLFLRVGWV